MNLNDSFDINKEPESMQVIDRVSGSLTATREDLIKGLRDSKKRMFLIKASLSFFYFFVISISLETPSHLSDELSPLALNTINIMISNIDFIIYSIVGWLILAFTAKKLESKYSKPMIQEYYNFCEELREKIELLTPIYFLEKSREPNEVDMMAADHPKIKAYIEKLEKLGRPIITKEYQGLKAFLADHQKSKEEFL